MKKRGFTLVELLAVIIIIAIVALIIFPIVTKEIAKSKKDLYEIQVENIIKAAKDMVLDGAVTLDENHIVPTLISIEEMQTATNKDNVTYLEAGTIKNPTDSTDMKGTVIISYDEKTSSYTYEYQEKTKAELSNLIVTPAAKTIIAKENILSNEQESGLFEDVTNHKYVYRGENPNNFLKINNDLWRIVSIDKDTYAMKVAKTTHGTTTVWNDSTTNNMNFSNTNLNIHEYLNSTFYATLKDNFKELIVENSTWYTGEVSGVEPMLAVSDMKTKEEKTSTINANVGLLSMSDIAEATYNLSCRKDYTQATCMTTNYLVLNKPYYLINTIKGKTDIWAMSEEGLTSAAVSSNITVIPVLYIKGNAEIELNGTGASDNPYILKLN